MSMILVLERVGRSSSTGPTAPAQRQSATPFPLRLLNPHVAVDFTSALDAGVGVEQDGDCLSLEKAWHGLHYLLTGETWVSYGLRGFLLNAGTERGNKDEGEMIRRLEPSEVAQIHEILQDISDDELWAGFDADEMAARDIYPQIWDEPEEDLQEEYLDYFNALKEFVAMATQAGDAIDLSIG